MSGSETAVLRLEGPLTMATAQSWLERGRALVTAGNCVLDFSAVSEADSAALALLFDWLRRARAAGHVVSLLHVPAVLGSLAALYGVDELLPSGR